MKLNIQMFSSTNHTTNYELSQYIGTDKPTYLGDYNSDMSKIDANLKLVSNTADSASSTATSANTLAQTAKDRADSAYTLADTANTTANTANNTAGTALSNSITNQTNINRFNFSVSSEINRSTSDGNTDNCTLGKFNVNTSEFTTTNSGLTNFSVHLFTATNTEGSVGKLYGTYTGTVTYNVSGQNFPCIRIKNSYMNITTPDTSYTIYGAGNNYSSGRFDVACIYVGSDGYSYLYGRNYGNYSNVSYYVTFNPCIYFFTDFGDTPE